MSKIDTWYVLVDGTHADPAEVEQGKDGKLRHKNGVEVALRDNGLPLTSGVATKTNAKAAQESLDKANAKPATAKDAAVGTTEAKANATKEATPSKAEQGGAPYKTRESKAD